MREVSPGSDALEAAGARGTAEDFVEILLAGVQVKGEFHCAECGYGVTICRELPQCPMCGNESWEQTDWSPFSASLRALRPKAPLSGDE